MNKIDTTKWKEFRVGDLFDIHPTKSYKMTNSLLFSESGDVPVVVNSAFNNGIGGYVNLEPTEKGNIITFSDTTNSDSIFYQENEFIGYSHVQGVYPYSSKWNKNSLLFFVSMFKRVAELQGFSYVNKFTRELAKEMRVKLPVHNIMCIDFDYIQDIVGEGGGSRYE